MSQENRPKNWPDPRRPGDSGPQRRRRGPARPPHLEQFTGALTAEQAASGIQAARYNALDLYHSAEVLYHTGFAAPATVLGILAIEEAQKGMIVLNILLSGSDQARLQQWTAFRRHTEKMKFFPAAILARVLSEMRQDWSSDLAKTVAQGTPDPDSIELQKQVLLYVDCYAGAVWSLPRTAGTAEDARVVLDDARALVTHLRDYTPAELEIWKKHLGNREFEALPAREAAYRALGEELVSLEFIPAGAWDQMLQWFSKTGDVRGSGIDVAESNVPQPSPQPSSDDVDAADPEGLPGK